MGARIPTGTHRDPRWTDAAYLQAVGTAPRDLAIIGFPAQRCSEKGRKQPRKIQVFHSNLIRRFAFLYVVPHADLSEETLFGSKEARE